MTSQETPLALAYIRALRADRTLTPTEKLFAYTMASHAGHDGTNAHPGHKRLGDETGTSERTSKRTVASLTEKGWLVRTHSGRGNNRYAAVYRLAIPKVPPMARWTAPRGQTEQAKGPAETRQGVISDSQGATRGPTNQPVEITKEIPVSQINDMTVGFAFDQDQGLTDGDGDDDGHPLADGEALDGDWIPETPQTILDSIGDIFGRWVEEWAGKPRFDPRYLGRDCHARLAALAALFNRYRIDMHDVVTGMFDDALESGHGRAPHSLGRIEEPARFLGNVLRGDPGQVIAYGERGKKITAALDAAQMASEAEERAARAGGCPG